MATKSKKTKAATEKAVEESKVTETPDDETVEATSETVEEETPETEDGEDVSRNPALPTTEDGTNIGERNTAIATGSSIGDDTAKAKEDAESDLIPVVGLSAKGTISFFEVNPRHPGGQAVVHGGQTLKVAATFEVQHAVSLGLIELA